MMSEAYYQRIMARCEPDGECLIWPGGKTGHKTTPYPVGDYDGKTRTLHRGVFEYHHGYLPQGRKEIIEHTCHRSLCLNPAHLRHTTQAKNLLAHGARTVNAINAAKTVCINGHAYTPENTYHKKSGGKRACRACKRDWARRNSNRRKTTCTS